MIQQSPSESAFRSWFLFINVEWNKVHTFWEGHTILRNLHLTFVLCSASQNQIGDFAKICVLLRIYELYKNISHHNRWNLYSTYIFFMIKSIGRIWNWRQSRIYELKDSLQLQFGCNFDNKVKYVYNSLSYKSQSQIE